VVYAKPTAASGSLPSSLQKFLAEEKVPLFYGSRSFATRKYNSYLSSS